MSGPFAHRDDFRLGAPAPTGPVLDHLCPVCEGAGDSQGCYCDGLGVIAAEQAAGFAETAACEGDRDPRWHASPLPAVPSFTGKRCYDCAFRPDSPERDKANSAADLFESLAMGNDEASFYCHVGMHHGAKGYVPRQRDERGAPIGHPICSGWMQQYLRTLP